MTKDTTNSSIPLSPVDAAAHLPELSRLDELPLSERRRALSHWVAWFNAHRHHFEPGLEEQIDEALHALDQEGTKRDLDKLSRQMDNWLKTASVPGANMGSD